MNKNKNIFLFRDGDKMKLTTYSCNADFMILKDMENLRQIIMEEGDTDTLTAINEKLLSENCIYCWDYLNDCWTEDFSELEEELEMIENFMKANNIELIEIKDIEITKEDKETIDKILNNEKGFKIIIELKTGDRFRTTDKPLTIKEVLEAIETFMKPNILGQRISNIDIQVVE